MKKNLLALLPAGLLLISLLLALVVAVLSQPLDADEHMGAAALIAQSTVTPPPKDVSEIGSTDGIVLLGVVIVLIVVLPILLRRKTWSKD